MDLKGYRHFRIKLQELVECINSCKGAPEADMIPKELLKRLVDKSEEWLELGEDINDQIKDKKQVLVKSKARYTEMQEGFHNNINDD